MEAVGGSLRAAARTLGIKHLKLRDIIQSIPSLRTRWRVAGEVGVPGVAAEIHRPAVLRVGNEAVPLEDAKALADALEAEDCAIRTGLLKMGIKGAGLEMALALQQMQRKHFSRCVEIVGGGITKQFLDVMTAIHEIEEKLQATTDMPIEEELMLREDRRGLLQVLGNFKDKVDKSALIQATVKKLEAEAKGGGRGKAGKPGFGVLVQGENIHLHERPPEE